MLCRKDVHDEMKGGSEAPMEIFETIKYENKYTYIFLFLFIFHFWKDILYIKYPIGS